jgi:hypothetical protein
MKQRGFAATVSTRSVKHSENLGKPANGRARYSARTFRQKMNLGFVKWLFPNAEWERIHGRTVLFFAIGGSIVLVGLVAFLMLRLSG